VAAPDAIWNDVRLELSSVTQVELILALVATVGLGERLCCVRMPLVTSPVGVYKLGEQ